MTETLKSIRDEIEKGCGEKFYFDDLPLGSDEICGKDMHGLINKGRRWRCDKCKAKLEILDRIKPLFDSQQKERNSSQSTEKAESGVTPYPADNIHSRETLGEKRATQK